MALGLGCIAVLLEKAFSLITGNSHRLVPDRNQQISQISRVQNIM
jgi:chemotaxis receptor (MCP) glutamine deamidase CheD